MLGLVNLACNQVVTATPDLIEDLVVYAADGTNA